MWNDEKYNEFKERLYSLSEEEYRAFHMRLVPGVDNILGIRQPKLKALAKEIAKDDWRGFEELPDSGIYEERMIKGLSIAMAKADIEEKLEYFRIFIPLINNWAVCDSVCSAFKPKKGEEEILFKFAAEYAAKEDEFEARVGIVLIMDRFLTEKYIDRSLEALKNVNMGKYYVDMAYAWALSMGLVKFEEKTLEFMKNTPLTDFVYNKALQKARESRRISDEKKEFYNSLKR